MVPGEVKNRQTVVVVDDEAFFRQMFQDLLGEQSFQLECYASGEEAFKRLQQGNVDLLLTDMVMPGTSGLDLLTASRTLSNPPEVILITGHASIETAIQALKNGARDYIAKPFDHDELLHIVKTALEQRRLLEENELLKKNIRLFQAGQNLASTLAVEPLMRQATTVILRELGGGWAFGLLKDAGGALHFPTIQGLSKKQAAALGEAVLPGLETARAESVQKLHLPTEIWQQIGMTKPETLHLVPMRSQSELRGALLVGAESIAKGADFTSQDLIYLAEEAVIGFDNAYRYEHARELMYTDDLTGLYNHRYMHIALDKEIRRSKRYGLKFSLVFIDLDRFKEVNDRYGHLVGSAVLSEIGHLLRECARDADVLCRFGGDEFAVLLLETDAHGAKVVTERIRQAIEEHLFLKGQRNECQVTATVGYATFPIDASDQQGLLDLADQAMYAGKRIRNIACGPQEVSEMKPATPASKRLQ